MLKFETSCAALAYLSSNLLNEVGLSFFRYFEVGLRVCDIVVKKFTFAISSPDEFLFAYDMRCHCSGRPAEAPLMVSRLERCIADVNAWCASRRLQLNGDKTEFFWFGSATQLRQLPLARSISVDNSVVQPVTVVRDLGVWIDSELSMREHVSRVV